MKKFLLPLLFVLSTMLAMAGTDKPARLKWAPPVLDNPIRITVTDQNRSLKLQPDRDYIISIPNKVSCAHGVSINGRGARNIVLIGGEIDIPDAGPYVNESAFGDKRSALHIVNWKGTFHIEGLWIHGADCAEGIDVDTREPGAILQVENLRVDNVHSRPEEIAVNWKSPACHHHPDIIQNWGGPTHYRIDRLTGYSDYQGFMLQPTQYDKNMVTELCDFNHIDMHALNPNAGGGYLIFWAGAPASIKAFRLNEVWLEPRAAQAWRGGAFPEKHEAWSGIKIGSPAGGNFVPEGVAGVHYVSPGYEEPAK